jgi:hypothetical protein
MEKTGRKRNSGNKTVKRGWEGQTACEAFSPHGRSALFDAKRRRNCF